MTIPLLIILALLILPSWISISYIISQLSRKGVKGMDALSQPSPRLEQFRSQHKVLFYLLLSSPTLLLFAALSWLLYEIFAPRFGEPLLIWILSAALFPVVFVVIVIYSIRRYRRILKRLPPRPQPSSPDSDIQEWQLKLSNEMADNYFRDFKPLLLIMLGIIVVWIALLLFAVLYLSS